MFLVSIRFELYHLKSALSLSSTQLSRPYFQIKSSVQGAWNWLLRGDVAQLRLLLHIQKRSSRWWDQKDKGGDVDIWYIPGLRSSDSDMERSYEDQENNLAPDCPRLPTLDSLTMNNMIVNKSESSKTAANPNWYLLKRFGGEESKFSTYRPSIHRGGFAYSDAKIEGEEFSMINENLNK